MAKTIAQHERQRRRRIERKIAAREDDFQRMMTWPTCGWCGTRWNPSKIPKWLGRPTCPSCADFPKRILHNMLSLKLVKLKKHSKLPTAKKPTDWGHLGTFNPEKPWMIWENCAFCTIPQAVNHNDLHQVRRRLFRGHLICAKCLTTIRTMIPQLKELGYLKMKKPK